MHRPHLMPFTLGLPSASERTRVLWRPNIDKPTQRGLRLTPARKKHVGNAIRFVRAALHGFVSLEAPSTGGFALPVDVDRSFDRLVHAVVTSLSECHHR